MSSGTVNSVGEIGRLIQGNQGGGGQPGEEQGAPYGGLTARQLELNRLWTFYRCTNYDSRKTAWDGSAVLDHLETETIVTSGFTPPGFYEASGSQLPLRFRRPVAPFYLAKAVVSRFNGLLFGDKKHPNTVVSDDPQTDDWITGFCEATRLWSRMTLARTYGGAMGSVAVGFVFKDGQPRVQVHDPRWCRPIFEDREELILRRFEKRYQYRDTIVDPHTGEHREMWFWYRRVIDKVRDVVWPRVPAEHEEGEPRWHEYPSLTSVHNFGFVPVVWIQNNEVQDDVDGDPDCHGAFDIIETIDALMSQANRGTLANCDPTLHIATDDEVPAGLRKGSDNAIQTSVGGQVSYLEINGTGPKAALEQAEMLETRALRLCRCVLEDNFGGPARTEKEVDQNYANMLEQAGLLREQYGERGVKRLLEMVLKAARMLAQPMAIDEGNGVTRIVTRVVQLPPNKKTGEKRELGNGQLLELDWPDWYEPGLEEINSAVSAAGQGMNFGIVDREHAVRFVAEYFKIEDVPALVAKLDEKEQADMADAMGGGYDTGAPMEEDEIDELDPALAAELEGVDMFEDGGYDVPLDDFAEEEPAYEPEPSFEEEPLEEPVEEAAPASLQPAELKELMGLVAKTFNGELPKEAAAEMVRVAFPVFDEAAIGRMLGTAGVVGGEPEEVQKTALNGAQVTALAGIVEKVAQSLIDRSSGKAILQTAFGLTSDEAEAVLGDPLFVPAVSAEGGEGPGGGLPAPPDAPDAAGDLPAPPEVPDGLEEPPGEPPAAPEEPLLGPPQEDDEDEEPLESDYSGLDEDDEEDL